MGWLDFLSKADEREIARREAARAAAGSYTGAFGAPAYAPVSPEAAAAWERSMAEYEASGRGAATRSRKRLNDPTRTEAYDPGLDMYDPGNRRPVDYTGRTAPAFATVAPPAPQDAPKPVTAITSAPAIRARTTALQPATPSMADWFPAGPQEARHVLTEMPSAPDTTLPPYESDRSLWSGVGEQPSYDRDLEPQRAAGLMRHVTPRDNMLAQFWGNRFANRNPSPPSFADRLNNGPVFGGRWGSYGRPNTPTSWEQGISDWLGDRATEVGNWPIFSGKPIFAQGGPVGYAGGGDVLHDILGTVGSLAGHLIPIPFVGPAIGKFLGHAGADLIGGHADNIDNDAVLDVTSAVPMIGGRLGAASGMEYAVGGPTSQRGGYPQLYTQPVRRAFGTGGRDRYVRSDGRGDGRSDHIDAVLSPGEYVMDAETTALLGDGDNEAGARKFDKLREDIRKQKGKALAKGKISPDAKPDAAAYMSSKLSATDRMASSRRYGRG